MKLGDIGRVSEKLLSKKPVRIITLLEPLWFALAGYFVYGHSVMGLLFVLAFVLLQNLASLLSFFGLPGYAGGLALFKLLIVPQLTAWFSLPETLVTSVAFWFFAVPWAFCAFIFTLIWLAQLRH